MHRYADGSESAFLTAARWGASAVLADLAAAGAAVNAIAYSNYLGRHASAAMWGGMYKSAENLRILHGCGCDLSFTTEEGVSAGSLAAEGGCAEALRFLLDEARVDDPGALLRAALRRLDGLDSREHTPYS